MAVKRILKMVSIFDKVINHGGLGYFFVGHPEYHSMRSRGVIYNEANSLQRCADYSLLHATFVVADGSCIRMDEMVWLDNTTDVLEHGHSDAAKSNSTTALPTTSMSPAEWSLSLETVASVLLVVSGIGSCANAVVLIVLIRARRQFGSSTHTLIVNQSAMDFAATVTAVITSIVMFTHGYRYSGDRISDGAICMIFAGHLQHFVYRRR